MHEEQQRNFRTWISIRAAYTYVPRAALYPMILLYFIKTRWTLVLNSFLYVICKTGENDNKTIFVIVCTHSFTISKFDFVKYLKA